MTVTALPDFSSVPGQAVPGMVVPGLIQQAGTPAGLWQYYGHLTLYYLDYLDDSTEVTLVAVPGGRYLMTAVNSRAGLSVPPPDGRWVIGGRDFAVYHPPVLSLAEARAAIGPGPQTLVPVLPQGDVPAVVHPAGSAAWDRVAHLRRSSVPPVRLTEARAAIGPGNIPGPVIRRQAGPPVAPQPALAEMRARLGPGSPRKITTRLPSTQLLDMGIWPGR